MPDEWILVVIFIIGIPLLTGIWLVVRAVSARRRIEELSARVMELEIQVARMSREDEPEAKIQPLVQPETLAALRVRMDSLSTSKPTEPPVIPPVPVLEKEVPITPQLPVEPPPMTVSKPVEEPKFIPPIQPVRAPKPVLPEPPKINWEQFLGVKGLAWIGGIAFFLFIAFAIQYSFQHNLIRPEIRMGAGFVIGLGLLVGGVILHRRKPYTVGAQTLCATGVLALYAVTFACRALYHFEFFGPLPTFLFMALITATAFMTAVRLNALVVAILGMLGGFVTPVLLSTGQDNPAGLFGYIAILDAGLIFVALNRRWDFLTLLAAAGTVLMQIGWTEKFFEPGKYFEGNLIFIPLAILAGFNALYLAANWLAKRWNRSNIYLTYAYLGLAAVAMVFTLYFFNFSPLASSPALMFGYLFLIDLGVVALDWIQGKSSIAQPAAGIAVFAILAVWTTGHLTNATLNAALGFFFLFAVFHSVLPAVLQRRSAGAATTASQMSHFFPPLALLLVLLPIFQLPEVSFLIWPCVLLLDLVAIVLAVMTLTLLPVLVVLVLTLIATGMLICKVPAELTGLPSSFLLLGAFVIFFVAVSVWMVRKFCPSALKTGISLSENFTSQDALMALLPASSVLLPFLLLIMVVLRLPIVNPTPVFGLALLLVVLLLGLSKMFRFDWMPPMGLAGVFALECAWHLNRFDLGNSALISPPMLLTWYLIFYTVFALFPFVFMKQFARTSAPWAAAALAGPAQFFVIYRLTTAAWPNSFMGLLPAVFAIPALLSLVLVLKRIPADSKARMTQLAWFGGVALLFITLIFPIQFDRQWITTGWALEGAALLWLYHRIPHPGLQQTGFGLLIVAFVRLAFNPAVLAYHPRSETAILNWYLYTYGVVTVALFVGTRLLAPPRNRVATFNGPAILGTLGAVLAFLLLNIEIADYFSDPGSTLTFQFSGNFARDMTYSIAWAIFAFALLVFGIAKKITACRFAALGLFCVTLLKLFFHDLAHLNELYRAGAVGGVAVVAMLASFAYQKFFASAEEKKENPK